MLRVRRVLAEGVRDVLWPGHLVGTIGCAPVTGVFTSAMDEESTLSFLVSRMCTLTRGLAGFSSSRSSLRQALA
jgi:hypothetical protein